MGKRENLVVGLDIGTSKVCAIVAEINPEGLEVVGMGSVPSSLMSSISPVWER